MNIDRVTALYANRFLGMKSTGDRFIKPGGGWMPRWRFAPFTCVEDAFVLLDRAASEYTVKKIAGKTFSVEVRIAGRVGKAVGADKARTISIAVANALGLGAADL